MKISVSEFRGMIPKVSPLAMKSTYSQNSTNVQYGSGKIIPLKESVVAEELDNTKTYQTIHHYDLGSSDRWLYWEEDVRLARDPIYVDTYNRTVFTGLDTPRIFDTVTLGSASTVTASNSYKLGLPVPTSGTITLGGSGTGTAESRVYVYAYTRSWTDGKLDDGPWSDPATTSGGITYVDVLPGQYVDVSNIADAPTGYGITHITLYRSASSATDTQFQLVTSFNIADAKAGSVTNVTWNSGTSKFTYHDAIVTSDLGDVANNQLWIAPPDTLQGLVSLNNGVLAGYDGSYIYFSEPYQCHAWPDAYRVAIDRPIVGIGSFGNTVVICTDSEPHLITFTDPAAAIAYPIKEDAPCVNGKAIVSFKDSVVFPSYEGFIQINASGINNITSLLASAEDIALFNIDTMFSVGLDNVYYGFYTDDNSQRRLITFDMSRPEIGFNFVDVECTAAYVDKSESAVYVCRKFSANSTAIARFNSSTNPLRFIWKSKLFGAEDDTLNFSAARIRFKSLGSENTETFSEEDLYDSILDNAIGELPVAGYSEDNTNEWPYIIFKWYVDGELVFTKQLSSSKPFRLPAGMIGHYYEFEISGYTTIYEVDIATSMAELSPTTGVV